MKADSANHIVNNIKVHFEMLCTDEIRADAYCDVTHDIDFQVFRVLGGYRKCLEENEKLRNRIEYLEGEIQSMHEHEAGASL